MTCPPSGGSRTSTPLHTPLHSTPRDETRRVKGREETGQRTRRDGSKDETRRVKGRDETGQRTRRDDPQRKFRDEKGRVIRRVARQCPQIHSHKMISTNHFFVFVFVVVVVLIAEARTRTELVRLQAYRFAAMPDRFMCCYSYKVGIYKSHSSGAV